MGDLEIKPSIKFSISNAYHPSFHATLEQQTQLEFVQYLPHLDSLDIYLKKKSTPS